MEDLLFYLCFGACRRTHPPFYFIFLFGFSQTPIARMNAITEGGYKFICIPAPRLRINPGIGEKSGVERKATYTRSIYPQQHTPYYRCVHTVDRLDVILGTTCPSVK